MSAFQSMKHEIVQFASLSKDALHIYVGMATYLIAAAVARQGLRSVYAMLAVLVIAALGEFLDARDDMRKLGEWRLRSGLHDFVNTLLWPLMLWLLARYTRVMK